MGTTVRTHLDAMPLYLSIKYKRIQTLRKRDARNVAGPQTTHRSVQTFGLPPPHHMDLFKLVHLGQTQWQIVHSNVNCVEHCFVAKNGTERKRQSILFLSSQQKADSKIYSLTQCCLTVNECDWHILAAMTRELIHIV